MIDLLERFLNAISDREWSWWPLQGLRPLRECPIGARVLMTLCLLFGSLTGLLILLLLHLYSVPLELERQLIAFGVGMGGYSLLYTLSFRWAWNRRARRLGG